MSVLPEPIASLPSWLVLGVAIGGVLAVGVAAAFVVGIRLFPDSVTAGDRYDGGERRRRAEIRRYLSSIGERYLEDHVIDGRRAPFYLPERGVAITFDARDYFRFERAGVSAVLLEYEVPGGRIGSRLPFETPEAPDGSEAAGTADRANRWRQRADDRDRRGHGREEHRREAAFAALGLADDASEEAVRRAYRERVKEVHPDHGGDIEAFRRLREAYAEARERAE